MPLLRGARGRGRKLLARSKWVMRVEGLSRHGSQAFVGRSASEVVPEAEGEGGKL